MLIVCPGCKNQINIDEATVPSGSFKVRCTSCGRTITNQKKSEAAIPQQEKRPSPETSGTVTDKIRPVTNASEQPENFSPALKNFVYAQVAAAKKEILDAMQVLFRGSSDSLSNSSSSDSPAGSHAALICGGDRAVLEKLTSLLTPFGYQFQNCMTAADALKSLDSSYGLIVIDPSFTDDLEGAKKMVGRINAKKAVERRQVFVVLLSATQKSLDGNSAFLNGVNLIVNKSDLENIESFVRQGQKHFQQLYSTIQSISH
jgi:predicted Zn finger-like uncharacterized protein